MGTTKATIKILFFFTVITGVAYPLLLVLVARIFFPEQAQGSLVWKNEKVVGSLLLAVKPLDARFFQPRPSATDYATLPSGASHSGPIQAALQQAVAKRRTQWGENVPPDLLTASGSGLDPHISPEAAHFQVAAIAKARGWNATQIGLVNELIKSLGERPTFGFIGQARVNVLKLNQALETLFP